MIRSGRRYLSYPNGKVDPNHTIRYVNQEYSDETIIDGVTTKDTTSPSSILNYLLRFIPFPISPILHSGRFERLSHLSGEELKTGLYEEHSIHILIECLFLTITTSPIYSNTLPFNYGCETIFCKIATALYFFNTMLAVVSILCHATLIFVYVEVPSLIFNKWILKRKGAILLANNVHMCSAYLWIITILVYPLATMSISMGIICICAGSLPLLIFLPLIGTYATPGFYDSLYHRIKLDLHPNDKELKLLVEEDLALSKKAFIENNEVVDVGYESQGIKIDGIEGGRVKAIPTTFVITLHEFLKSINLQHLEDHFTVQDIISISMLMKLENEDYRVLNISIGNRIKIKEALEKLIQ